MRYASNSFLWSELACKCGCDNIFIQDEAIDKLSAENSVLFMWTTDAHLEEAMKVINAWGFKVPSNY